MFNRKKNLDKWFELVADDRMSAVECLRIKKGTFKDVLFHYGAVRIHEEKGVLKLSYDTYVLDNPRKHDVNSSKFTKLTGEILEFLMTEEDGTFEGVFDDESV